MIDHHYTLVFSYLFTILNSSQGTIIFIFHCLISKNVRDELVKAMHKQKRRILSSMTTSSGGGSTNTTPGAGSSPASSKTFVFKQANAGGSNQLASDLKSPHNRGSSRSSSFKLNSADTNKLLAHQASIRSSSNNNSELNTSEVTMDQNHEARPLFFLEYIFDLLFCFCMRPSSAHSSSGQSLSTKLDSNNNNNNLGVKGNGNLGISYSNKSSGNKSSPNYSSSSDSKTATSKHSAIISIDEDDEEDEENESISNLLRANNLPDAPGVYQNHHQLNLHNLNTLSYIQQHHLNNHLSSYLTNAKQPTVQQQHHMNLGHMPPIYYTNGSTMPNGNFSIIPLINSTLVKNGHLLASAAPATSVHNHMNVNMQQQQQQHQQPGHFFHSIQRNSSRNSSSTDPTQSPSSAQSTCPAHSFMLNNGSLAHKSTLVIVPTSMPSRHNNNTSGISTNTFSTFKAGVNKQQQQQHQQHQTNPNIIKNMNESMLIKRAGNYDENQYLTPECHYHNYSTVDATMRGQVQGAGAQMMDDDSCNNYVEVVDEFIDDCPSNFGNDLNYMTLNSGGGKSQPSRRSKRYTKNDFNADYNNHVSNDSQERIVPSSNSEMTTSAGETTASETNSASPCQSSISSSAGIEHLNSEGGGVAAAIQSSGGDAKSQTDAGNLLLVSDSNENSKAKQLLRRL